MYVHGNTSLYIGHHFLCLAHLQYIPRLVYTSIEMLWYISRTLFPDAQYRQILFLPAPVLIRRWSSRFCPPPPPHANALAQGFIAYYPGMCPCFDLNFPVFCCLVVQPSSMAPLTGLLENRTPFIIVLTPREKETLSASSHRLSLAQ